VSLSPSKERGEVRILKGLCPFKLPSVYDLKNKHSTNKYQESPS
jgi:hypothetical protein